MNYNHFLQGVVMSNGDFEKVYYKILEIRKSRKVNQGIPVEMISRELSMDKEIVVEYVNALQILELIEGYDEGTNEIKA